MITPAQLQPFCSCDETMGVLCAPFTRGDWTYATDGRICVRVPRLDVAVSPYPSPRAETVFAGDDFTADWLPMPTLPPYDSLFVPCHECDGSGVVEWSYSFRRECGGRCLKNHPCPICLGQKRVLGAIRRVDIGSRRVSAWYLWLLHELPGPVEFRVPPEDMRWEPVHIRFNGGEGRVMPLREDFPHA
jgi:hypothetical protein